MRAAFDVLATADLVVAPQQASGPAQGGEVTCTGPAAHCGQAEEGGNRGHGSAHICWFETGAVMQRTHLQGLSSKCWRNRGHIARLAQRGQHHAIDRAADMDGMVAAEVMRKRHQPGFECFEGDGAIGSQQHGLA